MKLTHLNKENIKNKYSKIVRSMSLDYNHDPEHKEPGTSSPISKPSYDNVFSSFSATPQNISDKEEISFSGNSENYCVSFIDMVNSTNITAQISHAENIRRYYS